MYASPTASNTEDKLPAEQYLVPVGLASAVMDYSLAGIMSQPIQQCLRRLGVMELNREVLDCIQPFKAPAPVPTYILLPVSNKNVTSLENAPFVKLLASTLEDPKLVLKAVSFSVREENEKLGAVVREVDVEGKDVNDDLVQVTRTPLQREECLILLKYFNDSYSTWEDNSDARTLLRNAPLHTTIDGEVTSLADHKVIYLAFHWLLLFPSVFCK